MNPEALLAHGDFVRALARQLVRDPDRAEDVAQDSWLNALTRKAPVVESARAWLARIVRNTSLDERRAASRREHHESVVGRAGSVPSTAEIVERESVRREVVEAVLGLDEPYRDVILLRFYELLPPREIAARLGLPVETVRTRTKRGLERLRERLGVEPGREGRRERALSAIAIGGITVKTSSKAVLATIALLLLGAAASPFIFDWMASSSRSRSSSAPARTGDPRAPVADESPARPEPPDTGEVAETPGAVDTRPAVEIEVVDADGAPAAGAKLIAWRGAEVIGNTTCGADGVARLAAADGTADVAVSADGHPVHHEQLQFAAGRRRIALSRGAAISGSVEVDGRRPDGPVTLRLVRVEVGDWIDRAPADVHNIFASGNGRTEQVEAATKPDGTFRFSGLHEGWTGGLKPAGFQRYALEGVPRRGENGEAHLLVSAPAEGLLVRLHRWPVVKGRVVTADTHVPVPKAPVYCGFSSDSGDSNGTYLWTDDKGRFQTTIAVWNAVKVTVDAEDPQRLVRKHIERTGSFERDLDLGDIELAALKEIAFVVKDAGGAPIAGAVAATGLRRDVLSEKTDADGAGKIRMDPEAGTLRVGAVGYEMVDVPVPRDLVPPLIVTLPAGTRLDIRVTTPSGEPPSGIEIEIRFKQVWFDQTTWWPDPLLVAAGAREPKGASRSNAGFVAWFRPDGKGRVALAAIRSGVPIEIEARDELRSFKQVSTLTLGPGESREHTIVIEKPARALRGIVRDPAGSPLPLAGIEIWVPLPDTPSRYPAQWHTDAAGRFEFAAIYADRVELMIRKAGFVPVVAKGIEPRGDAEPSVFVLVPSRRVTAMVVDASGQRMRALGMMAKVAGGSLELAGDRNPSGDFDFAYLPEGTVAFRAAVGGRMYTQDHDTRQPVAKIVVPVHGSLQVKWDLSLESGSVNDLRVESVEPGGPALTEFIQNTGGRNRGEATVQVLPGRYTVWLETKPFDPMEVEKIEPRAASKRREITVTAGETASLTLEP